MNTISLELTNSQIKQLSTLYKMYRVEKKQAYIAAQYKLTGCMITVYESNKVVFQGKDAQHYATSYQPKTNFFPHAGSDEVGTGDYYGPVCVCACVIDAVRYEKLPIPKLRDSKKLTDDEIINLAPSLIQILPHSLLVLDNKKYNEVHADYNMNQIKALLHNQTYLHLQKKLKALPKQIIIDQFTPPKNYYKYLQNEKEIVSDIHFETKAEDKYLAVACASIIARYAFLNAFTEMEMKYNWHFPKGASSRVDQNAANFVKKYGEKELKNVAKLHFKNTDKLKEYL
jgi:ribonuclease HIII